MVATFIDKTNLTQSDVITISECTFNFSSNYDGKSEIVVYRNPNAFEGDYVLIDGLLFLIESLEKDENKYKIALIDMVNLFNELVFVGSTSTLATGVEDFIVQEIKANFVTSADTFVNMSYLNVTAATHTSTGVKPTTDDAGIYNLKDYIAECLLNYGIMLEWIVESNRLTLSIAKDTSVVNIDTTLANVLNYVETIEASTLAKVTLKYGSSKYYYTLKTDGTIVQGLTDPNRAKGTSTCISSTADSLANAVEEVYNTFAQNSYNHKLAFTLIPNQMIKADDIYIGRKAKIKTINGVLNSIITNIKKSDSVAIEVELGTLGTTLLDKMRRMKK